MSDSEETPMANTANTNEMRETILVVDDQPSNLCFVSKVLQALGYGTLTALNGLEAMRFLEDCGKRIQLVLLDTEMPGMDGVAFLQRLRKQQPDIPVIIVSRQIGRASCRERV